MLFDLGDSGDDRKPGRVVGQRTHHEPYGLDPSRSLISFSKHSSAMHDQETFFGDGQVLVMRVLEGSANTFDQLLELSKPSPYTT